MDKDSRNRKVFGILCLAVSIVAISFAYASFTHTLKVKAHYGYVGNYWDIRFTNISKAIKTGSAEERSSAVISNFLKIINYEVVFYTPGDSVSYIIDVENQGKFNAMVSAIALSKPICFGTIRDCNNALKYVKHTLTYEDGSLIKYGDILYAKSNDTNKSYKKKLKLTISYSKEVKQNELTQYQVYLKGLDAMLVFIQK